jgi:NAD(P)-dependent dehydrogenase (short-subunit alcohol dehydrogenase family)
MHSPANFPKVAVITGAGTGIGRSVALRLGGDGYALALFDRDAGALGATRAEAIERGHRVETRVGDVSKAGDVEAAVAGFLATFGRIDVLVNNAGILRTGGFLELTHEAWTECLSINLGGTFLFCRAVLPSMAHNKSGCIVNVASWTGKKGVANHAAYGASKAGILNLTQCLAEEFGPHGIRVNAVCPGIIIDTRMRDEAEVLNRAQGLPDVEQRTGKLPLRRPGRPAEIADAVAFLASPQAAYITGDAMNVTGGLWMG